MVCAPWSRFCDQDWPEDRLTVVGQRRRARPRARGRARGLPVHLPLATVARSRPGVTARPRPATSTRRWRCSMRRSLRSRYVETRDADDELGSTGFLREVVGQLEPDRRPRLRADHQGGPGQRRRPVQQPRSDVLPRPDAGRNAANAVFPCGSGVVWRRVRSAPHRRLPDLEPRRGPAVRRRGAAPRLARPVPADRRRGRTAFARGRAQRLQATRHVGDRHRAADDLGQPQGPHLRQRAQFAEMLAVLPQRLHGADLHPEHHLRAARLDATGRRRHVATCSTCCRSSLRRNSGCWSSTTLQRPSQAPAPPYPDASGRCGSCGPAWRPCT